MSTDQTTLYPLIRAAVNDYDVDCYIYSDAALFQQMALTVLGETFDPGNPDGPGILDYQQTTPGIFDNTLTPKQKLILSLETAVRLLSGQPEAFSYRSPVMSVSRRIGNQNLLINRLTDMLDDVNGGKFSLETDTDFNAIVQGFDRYINDYNRAFTAWPGQPAS